MSTRPRSRDPRPVTESRPRSSGTRRPKAASSSSAATTAASSSGTRASSAPSATATNTSWFEASGKGTVYSYTIPRRGQGPCRDAAPFVVAYVELEEGPRILTNLVDVDPDKPGESRSAWRSRSCGTTPARATRCTASAPRGSGEQYFDLNVEKVLEHWTVAHAVRELLANALDEHLLGHGDVPVVERTADRTWMHPRLRPGTPPRALHPERERREAHVRRGDRPLRRRPEGRPRGARPPRRRRPHPHRDRRRDDPVHPKSGFPDTTTLHAVFDEPSEPTFVGTEISSPAWAMTTSRRRSGSSAGGTTRSSSTRRPTGTCSARAGDDEPGRIYVRGVRVAEEETFLFSYDVTRFTTKLARALNRERRTSVAGLRRPGQGHPPRRPLDRGDGLLIADLGEFQSGGQHTESTWVDVALHASKVVSATGEVVFVTPNQLAAGGPLFDYAREEGRRLLVVPTKVDGPAQGRDRRRRQPDPHARGVRPGVGCARSSSLRGRGRAHRARADGARPRTATSSRCSAWRPTSGPSASPRRCGPGARGVDAAGVWDGSAIVLQRCSCGRSPVLRHLAARDRPRPQRHRRRDPRVRVRAHRPARRPR